MVKDLKQFISDLLKERDKEWLSMIENHKTNYFLRSQHAESEGCYINKIDLLKTAKNLYEKM